MFLRLLRRLPLRAALSGAALLALVGLPARAQYYPAGAYPAVGGPAGYGYGYGAPAYPFAAYMMPPSGMMYPGPGGMYPPMMRPYPATPQVPFQPFFCPPHPCLPGAEPSPAPEKPAQPTEPGKAPETPQTEQPSDTTPPDSQAGTSDTSGAGQDSSLPGGGQGAAGDGEGVALAAPTFGDLNIQASSFQASVTPAVLNAITHTGPTGPATHGGGGGGFAGATFPFHSAFNISENEIPRPIDRVWVMYNYYSDVAGSGAAFGQTGAQVHREMVGGEKTFLGGNASVGFRLPIFETFGTPNVSNGQLGDASLVFKYAFWNNRRTGDVFSAGLVVTAPTGMALQVPGQSSIDSTFLQPWTGGIFHVGRLYFLDFTSLAVPTDARDITLFFESFTLGYLLYRNGARGAVHPDNVLRLPNVAARLATPLLSFSQTS